MFILGHLFKTLSTLLHVVFQAGIILFIIRAVLSWFQPDPRQPLVAFIYQVTDPILNWIRRYVPGLGMVDISPLIAILALWFLDSFIVPSLADLGYQLLR